jgi:hypothetical protein
LANLLQMLEMEMATCILDVNAGQKAGRLYLVGGKLVNAECGSMKGEAAVYEMVCWPRPNVDIEPLIGPTPKTIDSSLTHLLLEAFRLKDETGREKGEFPGASGELELQVPLHQPFNSRAPLQDSLSEVPLVAPQTLQRHLLTFASLDGFRGIALFCVCGRILARLESAGQDFSESSAESIGELARQSQQLMETAVKSDWHLLHVEGPQGHLLLARLAQGTSSPESTEWLTKLFLVLVLEVEASLPLAKQELLAVGEKVIQELKKGEQPHGEKL